jgi:hypothetical protein
MPKVVPSSVKPLFINCPFPKPQNPKTPKPHHLSLNTHTYYIIL